MAENIENNGCSQRDNAEHEGYVKRQVIQSDMKKEAVCAETFRAILYKDNNRRIRELRQTREHQELMA
ncbi:MAG: hypothetical protein ACLU7S_07275 [Hominisplanchenecus sp.]|uniref:hypothetical protein n=1 Tax=Hominisplanchenecus sp. TaxID=3038130 RepID=UPI00399BC3D0